MAAKQNNQAQAEQLARIAFLRNRSPYKARRTIQPNPDRYEHWKTFLTNLNTVFPEYAQLAHLITSEDDPRTCLDAVCDFIGKYPSLWLHIYAATAHQAKSEEVRTVMTDMLAAALEDKRWMALSTLASVIDQEESAVMVLNALAESGDVRASSGRGNGSCNNLSGHAGNARNNVAATATDLPSTRCENAASELQEATATADNRTTATRGRRKRRRSPSKALAGQERNTGGQGRTGL